MSTPAYTSALDVATEASVAAAESAFQSEEGMTATEADEAVYTEARPYDDFPHAIVTMPDETPSRLVKDKESNPTLVFPTCNFYATGVRGFSRVASLSKAWIATLTAPDFSIAGWKVFRNQLALNLPESEVSTDQMTIRGRQVQIELHLQIE